MKRAGSMKSIASANGLLGTSRAFELLQEGDSPLDACVEAVTLVEDDPEEMTVGYGGLPCEEGTVELDAAVMDGPTGRGGAVAAIRGIRHPTKVARLVMQLTRRVMLVGEGAKQFALANGFEQENLLTEKAREVWLHWRRSRDRGDDWLAPDENDLDEDGKRILAEVRQRSGGTVHCAALDSLGGMACATSTSGHAFKLLGRVGDSAILGAGLYVDNQVGSCGSVGHGEWNMENLSSYAAVRRMARGMSPLDAGLDVLREIVKRCAGGGRELCDPKGRPRLNVQLFLLAKGGAHAGVAMWGPKQMAISDKNGTRLEDCVPLFGAD